MKRFVPPPDAPESWKLSFHYDEMELFGNQPRSGYARAYGERRRRTLDLVQKYAPPPARVIDIAAAQGNFTLTLAEAGYDVTWNDLRGELADYVEKKRDRGNVSYLPGNAFEMSHDTKFDVVLITEVIEHVAHPDQFLAQAARLVRRGGYVIMTTPNGEYFRNRLPRFSDCANPSEFEAIQFKPDGDGHIFLLHLDEVEKLAGDSGLTLVEIETFNNPLTIGSLGTRLILPFLPQLPVRLLERATSHLPKAIRRRMTVSLAAVFRADHR